MRARPATTSPGVRITRALIVMALCAVALVTPPADASGQTAPDALPASLDEALEREAAALRAERAALQAELTAARTRRVERAAALERDLAEITAASERVYLETARLERELSQLEATEATDAASPDGDDAIATQALETLAARGVPPPDDLDADGRLDWALGQARELLIRDARVHITPDTPFFDASGRRVEGEVLYVGRVAAAGRAARGEAAGTLAPADGQTQLLGLVEPTAGLDLRAERVPLLVFDPDDPAPITVAEGDDAQDEPRHLWQSLQDAGVIGWVILALGLAALLVALGKGIQLGMVSRRNRGLGATLIESMHGEDVDALSTLIERAHGELARVARQALTHRDLPLELYEDAISATLLDELGRITRGLTVIRVVAAVSPLLGLLGTVIGMIATFDALTDAGGQDAAALSAGIAQALATTQLGLTVAVPALLLHSALAAWAERLESYVEYVVVELSIHIYEEEHDLHHHHHGHGGHAHDHGDHGDHDDHDEDAAASGERQG